MSEKTQVGADDILDQIGTTKVSSSFVQRAGLSLAYGVGGLIAAVSLLIVAFLIFKYPDFPNDTSTVTSTDALESYEKLSSIAVENATTLFQTTITQAFLPVFTAILGYIFGTSTSSSSGE